MNGIIYLTQNRMNGKIYVGIHTKGSEKYLGSGMLLKEAIKKYGRESFERIEVDSFSTIEEGCMKERFWITELNSKVPNGYNLNDGGEGQFNPCSVTKELLSKAKKGRVHNKEWNDKVSQSLMGEKNPMFGKCHSDEAKVKMREARKGKQAGKHHSEETRKKMSRSGGNRKGAQLSDITKWRMSIAHKSRDILKKLKTINQNTSKYETRSGEEYASLRVVGCEVA